MLAVLGLSYPMCPLKTNVTDTSTISLSVKIAHSLTLKSALGQKLGRM